MDSTGTSGRCLESCSPAGFLLADAEEVYPSPVRWGLILSSQHPRQGHLLWGGSNYHVSTPAIDVRMLRCSCTQHRHVWSLPGKLTSLSSQLVSKTLPTSSSHLGILSLPVGKVSSSPVSALSQGLLLRGGVPNTAVSTPPMAMDMYLLAVYDYGYALSTRGSCTQHQHIWSLPDIYADAKGEVSPSPVDTLRQGHLLRGRVPN